MITCREEIKTQKYMILMVDAMSQLKIADILKSYLFVLEKKGMEICDS